MKKYTEKHEWVELEGDVATIGISVYAASELGDITYVELPEEDDDITKGESFCVVESVKAASDIYAPVSGTVSEVNEDLEDEPETVNSDAEGAGWICKVSGVDASDLDDLMDPDAYAAYIAK